MPNATQSNAARVILRMTRRSDGPSLARANLESRDYHRPFAQPFTDLQGFENWFEERRLANSVSLLALEPESDAIVGIVNINEIIPRSFQCGFLGFYGMARFAGRGLMTEAVGLAVRYAFGELGLHRLEANIQPGNFKSIALVKRIGFQHEGYSPRYLKVGGEWRDHERWAILADGPA